jgi:hypothetical protein
MMRRSSRRLSENEGLPGHRVVGHILLIIRRLLVAIGRAMRIPTKAATYSNLIAAIIPI